MVQVIGTASEAPARRSQDLDRVDGDRGAARPHRPLRRGEPAGRSRRCRRCAADGRVAVLRGLDPHPAQLRDRGQAPVGRHDDLLGRHVVGEEGRVAARHGRDDRRRSASTRSSCATSRRACRRRSPDGPTPRWSTAATAGTSTPPRRCSTRTRSAATSARSTGCRIAIVGDIKHSRVARSNVAGVHRARCRGHARRATDAAAAVARRAGRCTVSHDLDAVLADVDVCYLLRMQLERMTEALVPSLREYTDALRPDRRSAPTDSARRADHAPRPDEPRRRDRPRGRRPAQRR